MYTKLGLLLSDILGAPGGGPAAERRACGARRGQPRSAAAGRR